MIMRKTNQINKFTQIALVSSFVILSIGCGKAKPLSNYSATGTASTPVQELPEMKAISTNLDALQVQSLALDQQIGAMGGMNPLSLLSGGLFGGGLQGSMGNFSGFLKDFQAQIDALKLKINSQIIQLNPNDPRLAQLQNSLSYLDQVNGHLSDVTAKLQSKINDVFAKLEQKVSGMSGIQGMIAQLILGQLKSSILKNLVVAGI
jgi:hypothetical protein